MSNNNQLAVITDEIYALRPSFDAALVDRSMNFDREAGFALQIIRSSDFMTGVAFSHQDSLRNAVVNVAAIGLSLNPALKQAYLVPRRPRAGEKVQVCLDISYMGLIELAISAGAILMAQAKVVYENDETFIDNGPGQAPTHKYDPRSKDRGAPACIFVAAKLPSGDWHTEIMTVEQINEIRDRSEAWKSGKSCPWRTDWEEMAKKTVTKRASKWWRGRSGDSRLEQAIHYLNTDGGEGLADMTPAKPEPANEAARFDADAWCAKLRAAKTLDELGELFKDGMTLATKARDRDGAERFRAAGLARRTTLQAKAGATDANYREAA